MSKTLTYLISTWHGLLGAEFLGLSLGAADSITLLSGFEMRTSKFLTARS